MILLIIGIIIVLAIICVEQWGTPRDIGAITLISGGVKTGKSALSLRKAYIEYRHKKRMYYIGTALKLAFTRDINCIIEPPAFYTNIPVGYKHTPLTLDVILRKVKIPHKSVVWVDEASLLADSMSFKDEEINERLMLFFKLFGHYSHGGVCVLNTQSVSDLHYSERRCFGSYQYIHKRKKFPFYTLFVYSERTLVEGEINGSTANMERDINGEIVKYALVSNKIYKKYDCYAYSYLTDSKPLYVKNRPAIKVRKELKANNIIAIRPLKEVQQYEREKNLKPLNLGTKNLEHP